MKADEKNSPLISRTYLRFLAEYTVVRFCRLSIRVSITIYFTPLVSHLAIGPCTLITTEIIVVLNFNRFLSSLDISQSFLSPHDIPQFFKNVFGNKSANVENYKIYIFVFSDYIYSSPRNTKVKFYYKLPQDFLIFIFFFFYFVFILFSILFLFLPLIWLIFQRSIYL